MAVHASAIQVRTRGFSDILDISGLAEDFVEGSGVAEGLFTAFVPGATAGITTIEHEEGALEDLRAAIERMAPQVMDYRHDARWGDGNGFSHVRAALLGPSVSVPVTHGRLGLGTWQQLVLVDFDNKPRQREVIFHILGE